jgi:ribosome-binding factor A
MPNEFSRKLRVSREIQRELGPVVQNIAAEVRGAMVSVTAVDVAPDLRQATVYVSCFGQEADRGLAAVQAAVSRMRHHLATHLRLRTVPNLKVVRDESIDRGARMSALLNEIRTERDDGD